MMGIGFLIDMELFVKKGVEEVVGLLFDKMMLGENNDIGSCVRETVFIFITSNTSKLPRHGHE